MHAEVVDFGDYRSKSVYLDTAAARALSLQQENLSEPFRLLEVTFILQDIGAFLQEGDFTGKDLKKVADIVESLAPYFTQHHHEIGRFRRAISHLADRVVAHKETQKNDPAYQRVRSEMESESAALMSLAASYVSTEKPLDENEKRAVATVIDKLAVFLQLVRSDISILAFSETPSQTEDLNNRIKAITQTLGNFIDTYQLREVVNKDTQITFASWVDRGQKQEYAHTKTLHNVITGFGPRIEAVSDLLVEYAQTHATQTIEEMKSLAETLFDTTHDPLASKEVLAELQEKLPMYEQQLLGGFKSFIEGFQKRMLDENVNRELQVEEIELVSEICRLLDGTFGESDFTDLLDQTFAATAPEQLYQELSFEAVQEALYKAMAAVTAEKWQVNVRELNEEEVKALTKEVDKLKVTLAQLVDRMVQQYRTSADNLLELWLGEHDHRPEEPLDKKIQLIKRSSLRAVTLQTFLKHRAALAASISEPQSAEIANLIDNIGVRSTILYFTIRLLQSQKITDVFHQENFQAVAEQMITQAFTEVMKEMKPKLQGLQEKRKTQAERPTQPNRPSGLF